MTILSNFSTRVAVALSIAVHMAVVAVSLGYAGAGLFDETVTEAVPVSLVTPDEVAAPPQPPAKDEVDPAKLNLRLSSRDNPQSSPSGKTDPPTGAAQQAPSQMAPTPETARPAYTAPLPDISLRYQVDLGLKALGAVPPAEAPRAGTSDFDDQAVSKADLDATGIAAFRNHLKECGTLPAAIQPTDKVVIVLRATFTPDGRLATTPALIEASASAKGPALMGAAIAALQKCQPHTTLAADKFAEWQVLDLRFTPQDFTKG